MVSFSPNSPIRAKISDFGTSRMVIDEQKQAMTVAVGTPSYMAPEVCYYNFCFIFISPNSFSFEFFFSDCG